MRDDDSGLRHDGEAVRSPDDDLDEINPDGDQFLETEPLSEDPGVGGLGERPRRGHRRQHRDQSWKLGTNPTDEKDISASGTWRIAGSRAGVAYAFTASGADKGDDSYLYQLKCERPGGQLRAETDADDDRDAPGNQPFVFRVDDTDPDLLDARTGISYDRDKDEEEVDRSYIALTFTAGASPGCARRRGHGQHHGGRPHDRWLHPPKHCVRDQPEPGSRWSRDSYDPTTVVTYTPVHAGERLEPDSDNRCHRGKGPLVLHGRDADTATLMLRLNGRYLEQRRELIKRIVDGTLPRARM